MSDGPIRVLLVEDNSADARLVGEMLAEASTAQFQVSRVERLGQALESLAGNSFDIILLDLSLPDGFGLETVVQTAAAAPHLPIVVMSGLSDEDLAVRAVQAGAQDYLVKGYVDSHLLVRSIRYATERKRAEEALRDTEQRIRQLAAAAVQAHEEERQWLAYEIHDSIVQTLVAVYQQIQMFQSMSEGNPRARKVAERASATQQEAIHQIRDITTQLYPPALDAFGVVPLIEDELRRFQEDTGCDTKFDTNCSERLPRHMEVTVYRIFHEALTNIGRHAASAGKVAVSLAREDGLVSLQVQDDGPGFDVDGSTPPKLVGGLMSMRRRSEIIGGTLEVTSGPGRGTRVAFHLPVSDGG